MHARIDQLLSVLDREPVDATVHSHLEQCVSCSAQLDELTRTTEQLRALPQIEPPQSAWEQIAARMHVKQQRQPRRTRHSIAALATGVIGMSVAVNEWRDPRSSELTVAAEATAQPMAKTVTASRQELMKMSRELEQQLEWLPQRPAVERPVLAVTVDAIEQRVQWLDWRLSTAPEARLNEEQERVLWRERVTLMDSLIKLRYAESGRASF